MRSSQQETMAYTKSRQTQHTVKPQQETVDAQSFLPPQRYPRAQTISRISNTPSANTHAAMLNRSPGVGQSSNRQQLVLQLQQQYGNRYVNQVVQMAGRGEALQNATALERDESMTGEAEAVGEGIGVPGVHQENKTGLPDNLKAGIETLSGISMDDVKVHYNSDKPAQLQALAYTQGTDIYVGSGQEKHLPHEAWHVVQQKKGAVQPSFKLKDGIAINDSSHLEHEAEIMGVKAQSMGTKVHPKTTASNSLVQSPITANSPQQLKSNASSSGEVIQRVVDTWGGRFDALRYTPVKERSDGVSIGADIRIEFTPNQNCPRNVLIGLIQIVRLEGASQPSSALQGQLLGQDRLWAVDRASDSNPVYGSYDQPNQRSTSLTDNPPASTYGNQFGKRGRGGQVATLEDTPILPLKRNIRQGQYFETTAVVLEGPYIGLALGTVSWGWTKPADQTEAVCEPFAQVNTSGSSENFAQAQKAWNALADQEHLVPIPNITDASAAGGRRGCFLTTACVEYRGLSDDCEELTTLRQFRDTYLMQKPNGQELINMYYKYSPGIVAAIHEQEDEEEILEGLYQIIRQCVDAIKAGDYEWAYQTYCRMVMQLKEEFIPECKIPPICY